MSDKVKRTDPAEDRLAHVNTVLRVPEPHITGVLVDGYEEGSSIILQRKGSRDIALPGAAAMLNGKRLQAAVGAVTHVTPPSLRGDDLGHLADIIWSLSETRSIYSSVDGARGWGMSYIVALQPEDPVDLERGVGLAARWRRWAELRNDDRTARLSDTHPPTRAVTRKSDGARLVIRSWFHRHVWTTTRENGLSEQRIASLMARAGWESLPTARSAITVHNPDKNKETVQHRFYVVPKGWEGLADGDDDGLEGDV